MSKPFKRNEDGTLKVAEATKQRVRDYFAVQETVDLEIQKNWVMELLEKKLNAETFTPFSVLANSLNRYEVGTVSLKLHRLRKAGKIARRGECKHYEYRWVK